MTKHVEIRQAGRTIAVPEGVVILEAALADGIAYPHGCRSGRCGSCKSRLVSGEVDLLDHSRFALSKEERGQGLILACRAVPTTDAMVAWLGGDEETPSHPRRRLNCRVTAIEDATHDIKHIQLVVDGADPLAFMAGQYARLTFPGAPTRDYSMASGPGEREFEFHIRRVPGGAATQRIHALLKLGDPVLVEGPFGSSYLREQHAGPILCVAGGSGLAPIKGIVEAAIARGMKQPIHVYFGARSDRDLYLVDHFVDLAQRHPNLTFTAVLSDAPFEARWRTGFVTDAVAKDLQDFDGWKAYVAGPPAMVEAAMQISTARGLRSEDLHADVFFTPGEASACR
ncbi:CDP-4-dehydro-6-deoxyglucose reductase/ferredoxin-NAD(P)+ reductase (naphthalene dioxygenase ferredoxin-specific) [Luteibacter rhizovicinus]|uniref:CDP-4-dehydro-6-deoxyglucose reductase/ferredoxin-NAD(P)+ reductase (Naphthalene dioxygenase ferredoxin-specific) n=1 Tax=Luteibacter rhizovicinus TaxID=242606 RepID=A0A4R3YYM0_9GAMM|nr:2Fe-2S iron-sulfur cluster-binding protein [Luteibacter rhizovicinus]TCV97716.1 CDP-4-dehydro-6-deoxyglucose reductase/ferredoxin-NAD(P)+ reductase (naphthalene dioxygenase ferredoxin-specific) [Luteibacter rhizovicinus]